MTVSVETATRHPLPSVHTVHFEADASVADANCLRKALMCKTTALSADTTIEVNTSHFADEFVHHRVSLLPLSSATGVGDVMKLSVTGPRVVLASDMVSASGTPAVAAGASQNIMLALLASGERLQLSARAVAGRAEDGARFNHVVAARVTGGSGESVRVMFETLTEADSPLEMVREAMGYGVDVRSV